MNLRVTISDEQGEDNTDLIAEVFESGPTKAFTLEVDEDCWVVLASDPRGVEKLEQLHFIVGEAIKAFKGGAK